MHMLQPLMTMLMNIKCIKPHKTEQQVGWLRSLLIQGLQTRRGLAAPASPHLSGVSLPDLYCVSTSLPALFGVMRLCLEDNQLTSSPYSAWPVDSEHTCTDIVFTTTVSSCQASNFGKHGPRDRIHLDATKSMQTQAYTMLLGATKMMKKISVYT